MDIEARIKTKYLDALLRGDKLFELRQFDNMILYEIGGEKRIETFKITGEIKPVETSAVFAEIAPYKDILWRPLYKYPLYKIPVKYAGLTDEQKAMIEASFDTIQPFR